MMRQRQEFFYTILIIISIFGTGYQNLNAQKINRKQLVQKHKVINNKADSLSALTVGNGKFAFTVDITGLQTFPAFYQKGIPLGTQSEWGWHSFPDTVGYRREEALKNFISNGREISYMVQWNSPERNKQASNWYRQNPHRLQLGNIGLNIIKKNGELAKPEDLDDIHQELDPWTGKISSHFSVEKIPVDVITYCHGEEDAISVAVQSPLLSESRLRVKIVFPYPTGAWTDEGNNYEHADKHQSKILISYEDGASLSHRLDSMIYYLGLKWSVGGTIREKEKEKEKEKHVFIIQPPKKNSFEFTAKFTGRPNLSNIVSFDQVKQSSEINWQKYWNSGGAIDFSGSTDPRAFELERKIILSQYLMKAQEAGEFPPQETGLTYNSWFGKPHLEMHWWHAVHYALWGRTELLEKAMSWYRKVAPLAADIAKRQGFEGIRWQKMTDNSGEETPSSVGALLIWQQPHYIYFAELCYRAHPDQSTLKKYSDLVEGTADFMASFAYYDDERKKFILGKGLIPAQERFKAEETFNPGYELVYWKWALSIAQKWRERMHLPRKKKWDKVIQNLSALAVQDDLYLAAESAKDSYTNPEYRTDHPSILAALGVMPETGQVNHSIMKNTFDWIWKNWSWNDTWGWDFPMTAMAATRLGLPEKAIDALMMKVQKNTYLSNGHNYQDERLRIYMPGNGGLLSAIAMMVAGYDGSKVLPGIPKNGKWKVKWEGLTRLP